MLVRLIYFSRNAIDSGDHRIIPQLNAILDASNRNNRTAAVTGALMFDRSWFLQILEGEQASVSATYARILTDPRHRDATLIETRPVPSRMFGNWWMGASALGREKNALMARYGMQAGFDPRRLRGDDAMGMAVDLTADGLDRRLDPAIYRSFDLARAMTAAHV
jgi:hypothetical protein